MPLQIPQLDDRNFQQLVDEVVARIPAHTPEWNNFNQSDPGMTLVQLFAYMTENLLYRSNRIPEANRLKFLSLLRIPLRPASPGYGLVSFQNERGPIQPIVVDKGLEVYAGKVAFRTRTDVNILPISAAAFYKTPTDKPQDEAAYQELYGVTGDNASYYRTMTLEAAVPGGKPLPVVDLQAPSGPGSTIDHSLWVALVAPKNVDLGLVQKALGEGEQTLMLGIYPDVNLKVDTEEPNPLEPRLLEAVEVDQSQLRFEIAAPLDLINSTTTPLYSLLNVEYAENVLDMPGIVRLKLPPTTALQRWDFDPNEEGKGDFPPLVEDRELASRIITWIRISRAPETSASRSARISWVGANAARVIQSLRVENERLGVGTGTPNQMFKVANTPVVVEYRLNLSSAAPTEETFRLDLVDEGGNVTTWIQIDDLYTAKPDDKVYTLDPESGYVRCGDGLRGMRFPLGSVVRATYEYGGGRQGLVASGTLTKAPSLIGGIKVNNPVDTWGARDGETADEGEQSISSFLRHRDRLVTADDYHEIAIHTPNTDIGRVEVLPLFDPTSFDPAKTVEENSCRGKGTVTVMVVPNHLLEQTVEPTADRLLVDAVRTWLEPRRLITSRVFVCGAQFVRVFVSVATELLPGQVSAVVNRNVKTAMRTYLSPLVGGIAQKGRPKGSGFPLEGELRVQDLQAVVARVEGVRYVKALRLAYVLPSATAANSLPTELSSQSALHMRGLQLPWLVNMEVTENASATDPTTMGSSTPPPNSKVAVPVLPKKKC